MGVSGMRIGSGIDAHRFGPGRPLMLGTLEFEHPEGLVGHSDGDVVAHALCDALLAAAGEPDIGALFPPGARSGRASRASGCSRSSATGWRRRAGRRSTRTRSCVCERPRIGPHREAMQEALSGVLGAPVDRARDAPPTGSGPTGRGEGIACQATALVEAA